MLAQLIENLGTLVVSVISAGGYAGIALLMVIESACIPLPSEIVMPFAGYLVSTGQLTLWGVALAGAIGCNVGSTLAYAIGYWGGRPLAERWGRYVLLRPHDIDVAERFFGRFGAAAVFVGRLLPVVRTFIALPAGFGRMNIWKFQAYSFSRLADLVLRAGMGRGNSSACSGTAIRRSRPPSTTPTSSSASPWSRSPPGSCGAICGDAPDSARGLLHLVEVDVEDSHGEIVGEVAVLVVDEDEAQEFLAEIDLALSSCLLRGRTSIARLLNFCCRNFCSLMISACFKGRSCWVSPGWPRMAGMRAGVNPSCRAP